MFVAALFTVAGDPFHYCGSKRLKEFLFETQVPLMPHMHISPTITLHDVL